MHAQRAEVKPCALCSRQRRASGSVPALPPGPGAGPAWAESHKNAPGNAASGRGARVRGPFPCQPPDSAAPRSPEPSPGLSLTAPLSPGPAATAGGKAPGVPASRASSRARGARDGGGTGAGPARLRRGGAGREPGTGSAGRPEPSQGAPRGVDSGRCRHPAGEREREARPLAGRASVG